MLRVGILGCAAIARRYVLPALCRMPEFELRAIASRDKSKAEEFAHQFGGEPIEGYQALVDRPDIDVVYVPLPTALHAEWVSKLLQSEKHVMVEKSMAMNLVEARNLLRLSTAYRRGLMEHFQFLHHPQTAYVLEKLRSGMIGDIRVLRSSFGFPPLAADNFRYDAGLGGGALLDAGAYTLRLCQEVLGGKIQIRSAEMRMDPFSGIDVSGSACLISDRGEVAQLAWGFDHFYQCSVEIWGQKGLISQDRAFTAPPGFNPRVMIQLDQQKQEIVVPAADHFVNLWRAFHRMITENRIDANHPEMETQARLIEEVRLIAVRTGT